VSVAKRFRELLAGPEFLVMPGAYDALSARLIEAQGFQAVAAGGYTAIGTMLAQPDMGQSNMRDYADHYGRICAAVDLPVYVDADTGFGGVNNVRQMVRAFETAGVAGFFISDQVFPNRCGYLQGKQVIPVAQMVAKLKAALDARRDPDLVIVARTDVATLEGVDAALERCALYVEAGADMIKPNGLDTRADIERVLRIPRPFLATLSQAAGAARIDLAELEAIGVRGVTLPSISLFAAAAGVRSALATLKRHGSLQAVEADLLPLEDYYELVGLAAMVEREERYDREAQTLLEGQPRPARRATAAPPQ
jgi:2-methylisocitrate lyase-like PEP mutase family enzyme